MKKGRTVWKQVPLAFTKKLGMITEQASRAKSSIQSLKGLQSDSSRKWLKRQRPESNPLYVLAPHPIKHELIVGRRSVRLTFRNHVLMKRMHLKPVGLMKQYSQEEFPEHIGPETYPWFVAIPFEPFDSFKLKDSTHCVVYASNSVQASRSNQLVPTVQNIMN